MQTLHKKAKLVVLCVSLLALSMVGPARTVEAESKASAKHMVVVVDTSGSMEKMKKDVQATLRQFMDGIAADWQVILVRFDVFSEVLDHADMTDHLARERLKQKLAMLRFVGQKTNFDEGIKGAQAALFEAGVGANADIVLVSDGLSDPSRPKDTLDLVALAQHVFPQQNGYSIYLLTVQPGTHPDQQAPATQANVTTMAVSRETVSEVLKVIERRLMVKTETVQTIPAPLLVMDHPVLPTGALAVQDKQPFWVYPALAMALLLLSVGTYLGRAWLTRVLPWSKKSCSISLQVYGRRETLREFWLSDGESVRMGGGICDYPLPTAAAAVVTQQGGNLFVVPASATSDVKLSGHTIRDSTLLPPNAAIVFDNHLCVEIHQ